MRITHLFSASCKLPHVSQKNLFLRESISLALNWRRHAVTDEFCSISMDKSRKDSSRDETVSQVKHRVSLVSVPSNKEWTKVLGGSFRCEPDELEGGVMEGNELKDAETSENQCAVELKCQIFTHDLVVHSLPTSSSRPPNPPQSCSAKIRETREHPGASNYDTVRSPF